MIMRYVSNKNSGVVLGDGSGDGDGGAAIDIIDSLNSNRTDAALSANQGKILDEKKADKTELTSAISSHNTSSTAHQDIRDELGVVRAIAEGAQKAYAFTDMADLNAHLAQPAFVALLEPGNSLFIEDLGVPDYWWNGTRALEMESKNQIDFNNVTVSFVTYATRENITSGEKLSTMMGKIAKWFASFGALAWKDRITYSTDIIGGPIGIDNPFIIGLLQPVSVDASSYIIRYNTVNCLTGAANQVNFPLGIVSDKRAGILTAADKKHLDSLSNLNNPFDTVEDLIAADAAGLLAVGKYYHTIEP